MPDIDKAEQEKKWRLFEVQLENFRALSKAQSRYVQALGVHLLVLWIWEFVADETSSLTFFGLQVHYKALWTLTPAVITFLIVMIAGNNKQIMHSWFRIRKTLENLGYNLFFAELDIHKNFLDYVASIRIGGEPVASTEITEGIEDRRGRISLLTYPALLASGVFTTSYSWGIIDQSRARLAYIIICSIIQGVCVFPFFIDRLTQLFLSPDDPHFVDMQRLYYRHEPTPVFLRPKRILKKLLPFPRKK